MNKLDEFFLKWTFSLAKKGEGVVSPNPLVGAIITKNEKKIASGYHKKYGENHAEIEAINDAKKKKIDLNGTTIYVNLEPCGTVGKTQACANAIVSAGIKKVVFCINDPNPQNYKKGEKILLENGVEVKKGILEDQAKRLNRFFIKSQKLKIPYVCVKSAMSLDGKICDLYGKSKWISSEESRIYVHKLRKKYDAILVGANTCVIDNPSLDLRGMSGKNPLRVIIDPNSRVKKSSKVFIDENFIHLTKKYSVEEVLKILHKKNITSVLIEGGGATNAKFFEQNFVDEIFIFVAPKLIGGTNAKTFFDGDGFFLKNAKNLKNMKVKKIGKDFLFRANL